MADINSPVGIDIYVRKGRGPESRVISFHRPTGQYISDKEFLSKGFAFDGNSIIVEVTTKTAIHYWRPQDGSIIEGNTLPTAVAETVTETDGNFFIFESLEEKTLTQRLNEIENALINWFGSLGYHVFYT